MLRSVKAIRTDLKNNSVHLELSRVYGAEASRAAGRFLALLDGFCAFYEVDEDTEVSLFSTPGRTELGGNHTDHQKGHGLAASVNLDTIACVAPNDSGVIRIKSKGHHLASIDLSSLEPVEEEYSHSPALVRGIAARITQLGYKVGGFDAYTTSEVLRGSGLSSSATFEVLVGTIINYLYCGGELSTAEIAQVGQYAENVYFGKPCGLLDQMACATGGVIALDFSEETLQPRQMELDLEKAGYAMCIVDGGVSHARLGEDYAAIPREMQTVAMFFGKNYLAEVPEELFFEDIAAVRECCGDRAVLRAIHFFRENATAQRQCAAIAEGDIKTFLQLVKSSGLSSYMYLQNVSTYRDPRDEGLAVMLALAEQLLGGEGASRVHGGGFAGTIQVFVPLSRLAQFTAGMEVLTGKGSCHVLNVRSVGTCCVLD